MVFLNVVLVSLFLSFVFVIAYMVFALFKIYKKSENKSIGNKNTTTGDTKSKDLNKTSSSNKTQVNKESGSDNQNYNFILYDGLNIYSSSCDDNEERNRSVTKHNSYTGDCGSFSGGGSSDSWSGGSSNSSSSSSYE